MLLAAAGLAACSAQKGDAPRVSQSGAGSSAAGSSAAGGGTSVADTADVSGTRLRAQYLATADGSRQFQGWFDENLQISCHFDLAEDGRMRCLPLPEALVSSAFLDANCMQALVQVSAASCTDTPLYALKSSAGECGPSTEVYAVGAAQTPTQVFYAASTGCAASTPAPNQKFYTLCAKTDPGTFVAGASAGVASGHRLDPVYTIASDGSQERTGWFDTTLKSGCTIGIAADQKSRCLPTPPAIVLDTYSDPACSVPLAQSVANDQCGTSDGPSLAFKIDTSACPATKHLYAITAQLSATQIYVQQGGTCSASPVGAASYYQVTELNPPEFDLFLDEQQGTGRLRQPALVDADGASELSATLFDSERGESCAFARAADGQTRCLPSGAGVLFSDAGCTQSVAVAAPSCDTSAPHYAIALEGSACQGGISVHALGDSVSAPAVYALGADGSCIASAAPGATFYGIGAEVAPSEFVAATRTTE